MPRAGVHGAGSSPRAGAGFRPLELLIGPFVSIALFVGLVRWGQSGPPFVRFLLPLLMAGGLGGLVQVLIANKNKLQRPVFDPASPTAAAWFWFWWGCRPTFHR